MIPQETVQQILDAARIDEVVGDYVSLRKRGTNLLGICPFHQEKTPSFMVSPAKGIFKCFGCGKGGDSLSFVMEHEHYTYPEALRYLANKYNVEIVEEEKSPEQLQKLNDKEALFHLSDFAAKYFAKLLFEDTNGRNIGFSYFREREFTDTTIEKFQLGYCLDQWDAFTKAALKQTYQKQYLVQTGLSIEKEDKLFDRFKGRVMFPIHNLSGRVIGFGGRILGSDKTKAKYVNSPESEIYNKSQVLYGIFFAKKKIIEKDQCLLVEGYTDVISLHQAGVENVVSSSGTSLTTEQIKLISRFTKNITILYDGDAAGIKASFRGIDMILEQGLNVKVVLFPNGEDPDSYARTHRSAEVEDYILTQSVDFIRFKTNLLLEDAQGDPIKRAELIKDILHSISLIPDNIYRSVYVQECSRLLQIGEADLLSKLNKMLREKFVKNTHNVQEQHTIPKEGELRPQLELNAQIIGYEQEKEILRLLLIHGLRETEQVFVDADKVEFKEKLSVANYIVEEIEINELNFDTILHQDIFNVFAAGVRENKIPNANFFLQHQNEGVKQLIVDICSNPYELSPKWIDKGIYVYSEEDQHKLDEAVFESMLAFKIKKIEKMIQDIEEKMRQKVAEEEEIQLLLKKKQLDEMRRILSQKLRRVII